MNATADIVPSSYALIDLGKILGVGASEFSQQLVERRLVEESADFPGMSMRITITTNTAQ